MPLRCRLLAACCNTAPIWIVLTYMALAHGMIVGAQVAESVVLFCLCIRVVPALKWLLWCSKA